MGDTSAAEETQWIQEESAAEHALLFPRRRAKPDLIATALRAAAVGVAGGGSAGKSISGPLFGEAARKAINEARL